ncbi:MAG: hypothetical protein ABIG93_05415 [archaeon]|nr:hypothetical protein [Nanoarchaeota archaeon]
MDTKRLFDSLVAYHCEKNLPACLRSIENGQLNNLDGEPFKEGEDEVYNYKGLLVISNGPTLVDKLIENNLARPKDVGTFTGMDSKEDLFAYIAGPGRKDGAHLYDGENQRIARVYKINNTRSQDVSEGTLIGRLSPDFVHADGSSFDGGDIGLKTRLAIELPMDYPSLEALQIKQTAYGHVRMGKVTHFDQYGLLREFFFDYETESRTIVGVRREYLRGDLIGEDGKNYIETRVPIHQECQVCENRYVATATETAA